MNKKRNIKVGRARLEEGRRLLNDYRNARLDIEARITSDEAFWNSRHLPTSPSRSSDMPAPASAWMFSAIVNKHSDMMESIPSPICLAREESDAKAAETLNCVLPVLFDRLSFSKTYSDSAYDKLKHGTAVYGVFWDPYAENGIGEIDIRRIDLLNLYWEPGITDIEDSSNLFYVSLADPTRLCETYPNYEHSDRGTCGEYGIFSRTESGKVYVIDWYYKKRVGSKSFLHYIKFTGDTLLYSSENDPSLSDGFYAHGRYPFVFDVLFKESAAPCGYGLISITKGTQKYIDKLDENLLERSIMSAKPRYLIKKNVGLDKSEFLNWNSPIIEVDGDLTDERIKAVTLPALDESVLTVRDSKIDEMREVASNRGVNYGSGENLTSGVAITALQDAGNKVSRDIITGSWNAFIKVTSLAIELIREFYTEERCFRITRPNKETYDYINFSGKAIREKVITLGRGTFYRLPTFDIEVRAQKSSLFSRLTQNETIINLYKLGLFNSQNINEALIVLDALELEGKSKIIENISKYSNTAETHGETNITNVGTISVGGTDRKLFQALEKARAISK